MQLELQLKSKRLAFSANNICKSYFILIIDLHCVVAYFCDALSIRGSYGFFVPVTIYIIDKYVLPLPDRN